ncbi:protein YIF1B-A-like [Sycon ciliatum]|uniref:protein YIF1B-A-like n=1 Tax=Sycon ciliatum TaxID=27933 RepID=UPI0031F63F66
MAQQPPYPDPYQDVHQRQQAAAAPPQMPYGQQQYGQQQYGQGQPGYEDPSGAGPAPQQYPPQQQQQHHQQPQQQFGQPLFGQELLDNPVAMNMAMQYGGSLANSGKEYVDKNLNRWLSVEKLKYYFSVDTNYVTRKLALLLFPFTHTNWSVHYSQSERATPRVDVNAPDLYIPSMSFVTFVLTIGFVLGTQQRFSPEELGVAASSTLVWLIMEVLVYMFCLYLFGVNSEASTFDLVAFCGYKYVGMIICTLCGTFLGTMAYYISFAYCSLSLAYFLVRTLRLLILPQAGSDDGIAHGNKRRNYLLLMIAILQPIIMFWMTASLANYTVPQPGAGAAPAFAGRPVNDPIP